MHAADDRTATEARIPRVLHQLWLGDAPMPELFDYYRDSWRRHHPDWELRVWTERTLPPLSCQDAFERTKGFKRRYDMVRLELLRQFGGVIVDMDVEAVRPLDPLLAGVSAFVGGMRGQHVGNQVLGAVPRHPFVERAVATVRSIPDPDASSAEIAGKAFLRDLLREHPDGVTVFPPDTFYYEPSFAPPRQPDDYPGVYAVHHELASYAVPPPDDTVDTASRTVAEAADDLEKAARAARGDDGAAQGEAPDLDKALGRLHKAVVRLRRAVSKQERGLKARLRWAQAEREQMAGRLRRRE